MSGASWEPCPEHTREKHDWVFTHVDKQTWGYSINFRCNNSGCPTRMSRGVRTDEQTHSICFDHSKAVQLTDRDGNEI